jgi:hypothetical protein
LPSFIRNPKDFWSGVIFVALGMAAIIIGWEYSMGSAGRMGPAYFPSVLGGLLALLGVIALVRSFIVPGQPIEPFAVKNLFIVLSAVLIFGVIVRGAGLIIATMLLIVIGSLASSKFRWGPVLLLAVGLTTFGALVFVKLLGLPLPLIGYWFGG